jgi:ribosome-associated toxin RatA of RatAB toxin-antitoxin module
MLSNAIASGGRASARRICVTAALMFCGLIPGTRASAEPAGDPSQQVTVREERGVYNVTATFEVPQAPAVALAVLTDYEEIPRFMPDVRTSVVLERSPGRLVVEQEAVSQFMMFSKKVHLVLEVTEHGDTIRFVDHCTRSFSSYEGSWQATEKNGRTIITYMLKATPAFDVPKFLLKRLLRRDSAEMIARLQKEIAARPAR